MSNYKQVSLVIATYNSIEMLETTLTENIGSGFGTIIIIDGESSDTTAEVVKRYQQRLPGLIEFYQIPRKGLANARNYGTSKVQTALSMHAGPDNIISAEVIASMLSKLDTYDLVSCQTRRIETHGYLGKAHNLYKKRFAPGIQSVVGTPYIGRTKMFLTFPFNEGMLNSDDTELEQRLIEAGKSIYRTDAVCLEIGFETLSDIMERWLRWGRGDALFYHTQKMRWTLRRKIQSWLHPFKAEIIDCWRVLSLREFIFVLPFISMVMSMRYMGWFRYEITGR